MKLILNSNSIQHDTGKALLIKLPKSELCFWHTKRFCNESGKNGYQLSVWFGNDSWKIKAFRAGKNNNILESWEKSVAEVAEEFNLQVA
tara:strand:- start:7107 stop:7373 length:267 start_codon:yes stop_codon:yes gene_type:complete